MEAEIKWLNRPEVFQVNRLPAHSDHAFYESQEAYDRGESGLCISLNGKWDFCRAETIQSGPAGFYREDFDGAGFQTIQVPGHIELAGYGRIQYINTMYPWEGHAFRRPAGLREKYEDNTEDFIDTAYNPVGSYRKKFDLPDSFGGKRVCIRFAGVEQAMYVWLNGTFIGYAEDSFNPSEFDLTPYIRERGNLLAVRVHKWSSASFLEDQDFFRFSGIFRDVTLYAKPGLHVEDIRVTPILSEDLKKGHVTVQVRLSGESSEVLHNGMAHFMLQDKEGNILYEAWERAADGMVFQTDMLQNVVPWEGRTPYLYKVVVELLDSDGGLTELVPVKTGFRRIEIRRGVILLNGRRLVLCGINRHEWSPAGGRCITKEDMEYDIRVCRENHINAVRTCHYPNRTDWYDLCDEAGIYVMSETNLESHGSWQKMNEAEPSWNVPGSSMQWEGAAMDRAVSHFETLKNHPSIIFWSLGNESYAGDVFKKMNAYFKEMDPGRLTHYEGVYWNRAYEDEISDVESQMYAPPERVREYLRNHPKKPFLLCEFMHDMGNSMGGMGSYMELLDEFPMFHGGFIWDFIDQALYVTDEVTGRMVLRYGGDFDDRPSDYEFSGNGILFADRTEKPALQEVKYYYGKWQEK